MRALVRAGIAALALSVAAPVKADPLPLTGFNLAGAEFGDLPGKPGTDYFYPQPSDVDELILHGANVFRLPFRWERLQRTLGARFDADESARLVAAVRALTAKGAKVIVSPHNFGRYEGQVIGSAAVPKEAFAAFWRELAALFRADGSVVFGLMNEPHDMPSDQWRDAANAAIAAIREQGASNLILVPGSDWTGGHSWMASNAAAMADIRDPENRFAYEIHQYFDADFSGTHDQCEDPAIGARSLEGVTEWLARLNRQAFLAEFGATKNATCLQAMDNALAFIEQHAKQWRGWTYWAGGSWWGDNPLSAQPKAGVAPPQLVTLASHIRHL